MYFDEYGNIWASYEDYQTYLYEASIDSNSTINTINDMFKDYFNNIYIDNDGQMWESEQKYRENNVQND